MAIDPLTGQVIPDPFSSSNNSVPVQLPPLFGQGGAAPASANAPALPPQFQVPPPTPAEQAYSDWAAAMPKRPKQGILGTILAGLAGGAAGFVNTKAGYPGGPKVPLNAQGAIDALTGKTGYTQNLQDWANKGAGLKEAANEEQQRIKDQLGLQEATARIEASKAARDQAAATKNYLADLSAERLGEKKKQDQLTAQNTFLGHGGQAINNELDTLPTAPAPEGLPQLPGQQVQVAAGPAPEGMVPAAVSPELFGTGVNTYTKAPKVEHTNEITQPMIDAVQALSKNNPNAPDLVNMLGLTPGLHVNDKIFGEIQKSLRQATKPLPAPGAAATAKAAQATMGKLAGAGLITPEQMTDMRSVSQALKSGLANGTITKDEYADYTGYLGTKNTPASTLQAGVARMQAIPRTTNVYDKLTGEMAEVPTTMVMQNPYRFQGGGEGLKTANKQAYFNDLHFNIAQTKGALKALENIDPQTRAQIAAAMSHAATGDQGSLAAAWSAVTKSAITNGLSPEAQNAIVALQSLSENALGLRQTIGAGQGAQDVRGAILQTVPNPGDPTELWAKKLDNMENVIDRLEKPTSQALATPSLNPKGMPGTPPGRVPPGAPAKTYTQADVDRAVAQGYERKQVEAGFKAKGWVKAQ